MQRLMEDNTSDEPETIDLPDFEQFRTDFRELLKEFLRDLKRDAEQVLTKKAEAENEDPEESRDSQSNESGFAKGGEE